MTEAVALSLMFRALDLPEGERAGFVAAEAGDAQVAARVMALLAADAALEATAVDGGAGPVPVPPPVVGVWQLDEMIGAGGMGSVWRARRTDGLFDQIVAVKFMRAMAGSLDLGPLIDAERRSLARMDHDNIARILDGGTTADGLHYIVMEHVAGARLDDHAATLRPEARIALIRQAAAALAHAHQQGIVHCDVKPANLLVTPEGRVKLIDFGIARLTDGGQGLPDGLTRAYASPERIAGRPPTTADDVWALAVTLREVLTGTPEGADVPQMRLGEDLQAILNRATDPDPDRRYRSIDSFDTDLANWQAGRPVTARRANAGYVIARFAGRRPGVVTAIGAALAGLLGALAVIASLYLAADRARTTAETRFAELRALARFMIFDLNDMLEQVPGATPARAALSDEAQGYLDTLAGASAGDPGLLAETAAGLMRLAEVQGVPSRPNLGQAQAAAENLDRARAMLDGLIDAGDSARLRALRGRVLYYRAVLTAVQDQDPAGEAALARMAEADVLAALAEPEGGPSPELEALLLGIRLTQADAMITQGDVAGALALQQSEQARISGLDPDLRARMDWPWEAGRTALLVGDSLFWRDRKAEALAQYDTAVDLLRAGLVEEPLNRRLLTALFTAHHSRSGTLADLGDPAGGLAAAEAARVTAAQIVAWDPEDRLAQRLADIAEGQVALMLRANVRTAEALGMVEARIAELQGAAETDLDSARSMAIQMRRRAEMILDLDGVTAGCAAYGDALIAWADLDARSPLNRQDQEGDVWQIVTAMQENSCPMP